MGAINAVHLRGGPCDGEHPEPLPATAFPESLTAITVMDHTAWVGHVYGVTAETMVDDRDVVRTVLDFQRTVHGDVVKGGALRGPSS
jgi:hypothetical protein